jgi:hypothetical protein
MKRYRVRSIDKEWDDNGPDLLRPRDNARAQLKNVLPPADQLNKPSYKIDDNPWKDVANKGALMDAFDGWQTSADGSLFKAAEQRSGERYTLALCKLVQVKDLQISNCSPKTEELHSLITAQWPGATFSGGYVWKQTAPGVWSDHAWGTAIDESENKAAGIPNEKLTDWTTRMGRAGCTGFDYLLGYKDGRIVQTGRPDYEYQNSSADDSHEWHIHVSIDDHDGREPPRQGGVW